VLVREVASEPPSRLGKAQSSLLSENCGSDPVPKVGVKGTPSLAVKISPVPIRPRPIRRRRARLRSFPTPRSRLTTSVRPTLKSERPRLNLISNQ